MKIIRPKGQSFTDFASNNEDSARLELERGLKPRRSKKNSNEQNSHLAPLSGPELVKFLGDEHVAVLEQSVSVLNRVLRAPRRLRDFEKQAYIDRAKLAAALKALILTKLQKKLEDDPDKIEKLSVFDRKWTARVHRYTRDAVQPNSPDADKNIKFLEEFQKPDIQYEHFKGRWFDTLARNNRTGGFAHQPTAEAIFSHLFEQELQQNKEAKTSGGHKPSGEENAGNAKPSGKGLIEARGLSISGSVSDPRNGKRLRKNREIREASAEVDELYFREEFPYLISLALQNGDTTTERPEKAIGRILYDHMGVVLKRADNDLTLKKKIWLRHNQVRQFYQKVVRSERFKLAYRKQAEAELLHLLPASNQALVGVLDAKAGNADINELIRLGKIVAHSADIANPRDSTVDLQERFEARMAYFASSAGQNEVKRSEALTKVWRTSVALSLRTLGGWLHPLFRKDRSLDKDFDVTATGTQKKILEQLAAYDGQGSFRWNHINLIFGNDRFPDIADHSRAQIFTCKLDETSGTEKDKCRITSEPLKPGFDQDEIVWTFLRLATAIRDKTNHFNVKHRLINEITGQLLKYRSQDDNSSRFEKTRKRHVASSMKCRLQKLLEFDTKLQRQILLNVLNSHEASAYATGDQLDRLLEELTKFLPETGVSTPKFMSLMKRANNLSRLAGRKGQTHAAADGASYLSTASLAHFGLLELGNLSREEFSTENHFRIGIIRLLYQTGFPSWLNEKRADKAFFREAFQKVFASREYRGEELAKEQRTVAETSFLLKELNTDAFSDLPALMAKLASEAAGEERGRHEREKTVGRKRARRGNHVKQGWQATLLQDIYGHLFAEYLAEKFSWLWVTLLPRVADPTPLKLDKIPQANAQSATYADWECQFYAWLYLVPPDQVAMLRHQIHKTMALEDAAERDNELPPHLNAAQREDDKKKLSKISRLMALYCAVQDAGFSGTEHLDCYSYEITYDEKRRNIRQQAAARLPKISEDPSGSKPLPLDSWVCANLFYANPHQFFSLHAPQDESLAIAGTRRGLRQIMRFGHLHTVQRIIEKHRISEKEIANLNSVTNRLDGNPVHEIFTKRETLHREIENLWENRRENKTEEENAAFRAKLTALATEYEKLATQAALHDFAIAGARLRDFADLHYLTLRIITRLLGFTMTWERDAFYAYLGMLSDKYRNVGLDDSGKVISLEMNLTIDCEEKENKEGEGTHFAISLHLGNLGSGKNSLLPLWEEERGVTFMDNPREINCDLLSNEHKKMFEDNFLKLATENPKDQQAKQIAEKSEKAFVAGKYSFRDEKKKIRNDFAHFNVLIPIPTAKGYKHRNLTYLMNAVRSLVSYDRKLKNSISGAIKDIVADAGLEISWSIKRDRLSDPLVVPATIVHLDWLPEISGKKLSVTLPRRSARFNSMVKALFSFDTDGYVKPLEGGATELGKIEYPREFKELYRLEPAGPTQPKTCVTEEGGKGKWCYEIPQSLFDPIGNLPQNKTTDLILK